MKVYYSRLVVTTILAFLLGTMGLIGGAAAPETGSYALTPDKWVGKNFTFLTLPADKQAVGYEMFANDQAVYIPYASHVGKQVTVTDVVTYPAGDKLQEYIVYMTLQETGEKLVGRTMRGQLEGLVLTDDLQNAKQQFMNQTIYTKQRVLADFADPQSPASITTPIGSALKVIDVYAGIQSREPIWLVVSANGQTAILPLAYSWTNQPPGAWTATPPWQNALFMEDPRVSFDWPQATWDQIEAGIVQPGMNKDQIRLSWGPPVRIDTTPNSQQSFWLYGNNKLEFDGETLTVISSVKTDDSQTAFTLNPVPHDM